MFDTPDLRPLCLAPFVAIFVGFIVYASGLGIKWLIENKTGKPLSWLKPIILLTSLIVAPVACVASVFLNIGAFDPLPWFEPTPENVIGEWQLATDTVYALEKWENFPVQEHALVFKDDGTFIMNNVPNFWIEWRTVSSGERYVTGSGTWQIAKPYDQWTIIAKLHTINDIQYRDSEVTFYFERHLPPYQLVIRWFEGKENPLMFRFDKQ